MLILMQGLYAQEADYDVVGKWVYGYSGAVGQPVLQSGPGDAIEFQIGDIIIFTVSGHQSSKPRTLQYEIQGKKVIVTRHRWKFWKKIEQTTYKTYPGSIFTDPCFLKDYGPAFDIVSQETISYKWGETKPTDQGTTLMYVAENPGKIVVQSLWMLPNSPLSVTGHPNAKESHELDQIKTLAGQEGYSVASQSYTISAGSVSGVMLTIEIKRCK